MFDLLKKILRDGGPAFCQFAITDACNARCAFCNFSNSSSPPRERVFVNSQLGLQALEALQANAIEYVAFVGGEPTLHPALTSFIKRGTELGMQTLICTNGSVLTPDAIKKWADAGLAGAIISIDAADAEAHERNRGLPGVCTRIAAANSILSNLGIRTAASVTISRLLPNFENLPSFLESLGFESVTFSYPLRILESSFRGYSQSYLVDYTPEELCRIFDDIVRLKSRFRVLNPTESISDMKRLVSGERQVHPCLAGFKYFHLDWNLDLYRCHAWPEPICKVWEMNKSKLMRDRCTKCMIDCYRDASVLQAAAVSLHDAVCELRQGHPLAASAKLLNRATLGSVRAVLEQGAWSELFRKLKSTRRPRGRSEAGARAEK